MGQSVAGRGVANALREALAPVGLFEAGPGDIGEIRALAAELIGPQIAGEAALRTILQRTGYGFYVAREAGRISALMALLLLSVAGHAAVRGETFDPLGPDPNHAVTPREAPSAVYGWGIAAATRDSARILVRGSWTVLDVVPRPFFVRAATEAGRRMLTEKMSFVPYPGSTTGLLWWDAGQRHTRRAA